MCLHKSSSKGSSRDLARARSRSQKQYKAPAKALKSASLLLRERARARARLLSLPLRLWRHIFVHSSLCPSRLCVEFNWQQPLLPAIGLVRDDLSMHSLTADLEGVQ